MGLGAPSVQNTIGVMEEKTIERRSERRTHALQRFPVSWVALATLSLWAPLPTVSILHSRYGVYGHPSGRPPSSHGSGLVRLGSFTRT